MRPLTITERRQITHCMVMLSLLRNQRAEMMALPKTGGSIDPESLRDLYDEGIRDLKLEIERIENLPSEEMAFNNAIIACVDQYSIMWERV